MSAVLFGLTSFHAELLDWPLQCCVLRVANAMAGSDAARRYRSAGNGILKVAKMVGCGSGTVQRVKREMADELVEAA